MKSSVDWTDLLKKAQQGDAVAQNQLCEALAVRLREVVQHRLWGWPTEEQEDLIQEVLIVFWDKLPQIRTNPHGFAMEILRHKIGNLLREKQRGHNPTQWVRLDKTSTEGASSLQLILKNNEADSDPLAKLEAADQVDQICLALKKLSLFCRNFFLGILESHEIHELWQHFQSLEPGLKRNAFDKRIFDCRKKLISVLNEQFG